MRIAIAFLGALAISLISLVFGLWWLTFPAGLLAGVIVLRARLSIPIGGLAGLIGWAIPLIAAQLRYGLGSAASSLAAIMGFGHQGAIPVVLTLLVGLLLGLTGAWLGSALRSVVAPRARVVAAANE